MKGTIKKISISKPCTERWNAMQGDDLNKFCSTCQKNVRNFEGFSESEVIKILELEQTTVCGRFRITQIEDINRILRKRSQNKMSQKAASMLIGAILLGSSCSTNNVFPHEHYTKAEVKISSPINNSDSLNHSIVIGRTTDEEGKPISFVNVQVDKNQMGQEPIGTTSDESGIFKLTVPKNEEYQDSIKLDYLGYQSSYIDLNQVQNKEIEIIMKESAILLGEVCIERK